MNASDRVALMLGRSILRAEALADELADAKRRLGELEGAEAEPPPAAEDSSSGSARDAQ